VSLGSRLGRLARGFVSNVGDERFRETVRPLRQRGETLRSAVGAAWRGAAAEWRAAEERAAAEEENGGERASAGRAAGATWGAASYAPPFVPRRYPPQVLYAYHRLGLNPGDPLETVNKRRRDLVKRHHPDRFVESGQRARAERITAEINASHDLIERHLLR
jgi:DnaJ-domain-containing protein 1